MATGPASNEFKSPFICDTNPPQSLFKSSYTLRPVDLKKYIEKTPPFQVALFIRAQGCQVLISGDRCPTSSPWRFEGGKRPWLQLVTCEVIKISSRKGSYGSSLISLFAVGCKLCFRQSTINVYMICRLF